MARFNMGSTVILLLPPGAADWDGTLKAGQTLRMGERIGTLRGWHPGSGTGGELKPVHWRPTRLERAHCACARRRCAPRASSSCARKVLEVETPAMVNAPVSDVNLGSVRVQMSGQRCSRCSCTPRPNTR